MPEILRTGVLWLTHEAGLNDLREHLWPFPFIREEIQRRTTADTAEFLIEIAEQLDLMMGDRVRDLYVGSFSRRGDVLSQWRAYAKDGDGFAIGFSPKAFDAKLQIPNVSMFDGNTIGLLEIQYDDDALKREIAEIFDYHLSPNQKRYDASFPRGFRCVSQLRDLALSFKNPAFHEEKEWRITYSPSMMTSPEEPGMLLDGALKSIKFRTTRYGVVPYFEMPFRRTMRENAIVEIVIGPRNRSKTKLVEMFLDTLGYLNTRVRNSLASYR